MELELWIKRDKEGNTPLHVVCRCGTLEALKSGFLQSDNWSNVMEEQVMSCDEGEGWEGQG